MAKTIREERLRWILPIATKDMRMIEVAKICPHSKRSLERWLAAYKNKGERALEPKSTEPKTQKKETALWIKERAIAIRKQTKKCALKIHWQLAKEGIFIHERTIGKILKKEGLVRKYRTRKIKYRYIKAPRKAGELFEIDVKYVPGRIAGQRYFQYTAIDTASRWRYLRAYAEQTNHHSILFLKEVMERFPHKIQAIKTDNGAIFTNYYTGMTIKTIHALDVFCRANNIVHFLIDPGKPAQNGTVERSHREDQEKFYDQNRFKSFGSLQKGLKKWNLYYNDLEHCGLNGKTPNEFLADYHLIKPPNVRA